MSFHEIFEKSRLDRSQDKPSSQQMDKSTSPTKDNEPDTSPDADDFYFWEKISTDFSIYLDPLVTQHETLLLVIFAGPTIIIPV